MTSDKHLHLGAQVLSFAEELGQHMPGGFFIYRAEQPEDLLYANQTVFDIFGCANLEEFKELTGYTFRGMLHPDDYRAISASIDEQIDASKNHMDHVEYRIVRKDGEVRWVDDYGHYIETEEFGGVYYVFIYDITDKRLDRERDFETRGAVIDSLINAYNTVWLIEDVETEHCSLYHTDMDVAHEEAIRNALSHARYTDTKTEYVETMVAEQDQERMQTQISLPYILEQFEKRDRFTVDFVRALDSGPRHYRIDFGKIHMPAGRTGVMMGFRDVDDEVRQDEANRRALQAAKRTEEENRRLMEEVQSAAKLADLMGSVTSLLTNMPAMSFSKDADTGVYLACNQAFAEYAHKSTPDEVVGLTDHEIFDAETAQHFVEDDAKALAMEDAYVFFEDVPDAGGKIIRNLQTTKTKFRDPSGRLCLLGMCVDITEMTRIKTTEATSIARQQELEERLRLQDELLEQEKQRRDQDRMITALASDYRSVYQADLDLDDAVCFRADPNDPEQPAEGVHFPFHEMFAGYANLHVDEEYLEGFLDFIDPENIRAALADKPIIAYRYLVRRGGREYYEMLRMAGVRRAEDRDDHTVHAVGVGFTVIDAEMRETLANNRALSEALSAAEQANRAKTAFLSNMSHEIRTPMNAIIGLDSIALADEEVPARTREHLEKIGSSAHHLLDLINDILDVSRIESGRMTINNETFSLSKLLEQVNTIVGGQCDDKGLDYTCRVSGQVSDNYIGDAVKLKQVLINILGNAVKFTPAGGSVEMLIEAGAQYEDHTVLRFTMSDTGIGMDESFLPHVFDTFSQEDAATTSKYGSTGLGLAITKSIVEMMNGTIDVQSVKGEGSTFIVTVTLADAEGPAGDFAQFDVVPHELNVLVIDDDPVACEHAKLVLEEVGISAQIAQSGAEAVDIVRLQHARREAFDLILVDWKMPEMDGIETTRQIRSLIGDESAIIILTAYNWDDIVDEALEAGISSFIAKPLFAASILDEFHEALKKRDVSDQTAERTELAGRKILLAEDVQINAEIIMHMLGMKDMQVDHAENGRVAVEKFAQSEPGHYDAILMDMRMPEMDGLAATAAIRAMDRPDAETVPIIALTANAFDEDVQKSLQAGLNAHLSKPIEPESVFATLESLIRD